MTSKPESPGEEENDEAFKQTVARLAAQLAAKRAKEAAAQPAAPEPPAPPPKVEAPKLGAATRDIPPKAPEPPKPAPAPPRHVRRGRPLASALLWALGLGAGAVVAGGLVAFLVNGPPHRSAPAPREIAAAPTPVPEPAAPPPAPVKIADVTPPPAPAPVVAPAPAPPVEEVMPTKSATSPAAPPSSDVPAATAAPDPTHLASADIREVQARLKDLGFNPGPLDGSAGPQTVAAVTRYQQAHGLATTGSIDRDMLEKLRQDRARPAPPPPSRAARPPPPPPPPAQAARRGRSPMDDFADNVKRFFRGY